MAATWARAKQLAREYKAAIEQFGTRPQAWEFFAPDRRRWVSDGTHTIIAWSAAEAIDRMSMGLESCTDPDCTWCEFEDDSFERKLRSDAQTVDGGKEVLDDYLETQFGELPRPRATKRRRRARSD